RRIPFRVRSVPGPAQPVEILRCQVRMHGSAHFASDRMTKELSTAKFIALLSLRVDLGKPRQIPDPLPKAKDIVIAPPPRKAAFKVVVKVAAERRLLAVSGLFVHIDHPLSGDCEERRDLE